MNVKQLNVGDIFKLQAPAQNTSTFFMKIALNNSFIKTTLVDVSSQDPERYYPKNPIIVMNLLSNSLGLVDSNSSVRLYREMSPLDVEEILT